jgi:hypothetical protein
MLLQLLAQGNGRNATVADGLAKPSTPAQSNSSAKWLTVRQLARLSREPDPSVTLPKEQSSGRSHHQQQDAPHPRRVVLVSRKLRHADSLAGGSELRTNICEGRFQLAAERVHDHDDRDGDPGCDQSVLDCGSCRFVFDEVFARLAMLMSPNSKSN